MIEIKQKENYLIINLTFQLIWFIAIWLIILKNKQKYIYLFMLHTILGNIKCDFRTSLLAHTFASPCLCREPKTKVATGLQFSMSQEEI